MHSLFLLLFTTLSLTASDWNASWIRLPVGKAQIQIHKAEYIAVEKPGHKVDLTQKVRITWMRGNMKWLPLMTSRGEKDPLYLTAKSLELSSSVNRTRYEKSLAENEKLNLAGGEAVNKVNQWICFRKSLTLAEAPTESLAKISADSMYWLWINGKMVGYEGQLKRDPTPQDTYYDEVDLANHAWSGSALTLLSHTEQMSLLSPQALRPTKWHLSWAD